MDTPFHVRVRQTRLSLGWSQTVLALRIGRSDTYLSLIELGNKSPTAIDRERLCAALGLPLLDAPLPAARPKVINHAR